MTKLFRFFFTIPLAFMVIGIIAIIRLQIIMKQLKGKEHWKLDDWLIPEERWNEKYSNVSL